MKYGSYLMSIFLSLTLVTVCLFASNSAKAASLPVPTPVCSQSFISSPCGSEGSACHSALAAALNSMGGSSAGFALLLFSFGLAALLLIARPHAFQTLFASLHAPPGHALSPPQPLLVNGLAALRN